MLIVQAVAAECSRRGWGFGLPDDGQASFQITIGDDGSVSRCVELERREVPTRTSWLRRGTRGSASRLGAAGPSGRLMVRLDSGYRSVFWADRRRWTLTEKLPEVFEEVATRASLQAGERRRKEQEREQRRNAWEQAVPRARQAYIDQLNRDRLADQVARAARPGPSVATVPAGCPDPRSGDPGRAGQIRAWAAWARQEADRLDPLRHLAADYRGAAGGETF